RRSSTTSLFRGVDVGQGNALDTQALAHTRRFLEPGLDVDGLSRQLQLDQGDGLAVDAAMLGGRAGLEPLVGLVGHSLQGEIDHGMVSEWLHYATKRHPTPIGASAAVRALTPPRAPPAPRAVPARDSAPPRAATAT